MIGSAALALDEIKKLERTIINTNAILIIMVRIFIIALLSKFKKNGIF